MFYAGPDLDDDDDFTPTSSSSGKLASLFGRDSSNKSSNFKYVAPKQPRGDRADSMGSEGGTRTTTAPAPQQQQATAGAPAVLMALPVHAYLYVNGVAQSQGRVMCCIIGSSTENNFQLLLYRTKQDHLTRVKLHPHFSFTVQPNYYANFTDDQQRSWSVNVSAEQYSELVTQVGICRALGGGGGNQVTQDVRVGEGPALGEGDHLQLSLACWKVAEGKKGPQVQEKKSGQRVKLKEGAQGWEGALMGAQKNSHRLIFIHNPDDTSAPLVYEVTVDRVKQKGGDMSGRATPQPTTHTPLLEEHTPHPAPPPMQPAPPQSLPEDTNVVTDDADGASTKPSLVSRMAKVGHPLLPSRMMNKHIPPPTDSESEVEEVGRQRPLRHSSGSAEEVCATPALRSRSSSSALRPEPAPRPSHLAPQQLVVYQSAPWQQPAIMPGQYPGVEGPVMVPPQQPAPASDPTLSLLFSDTRSQNTELKVDLAKISVKIDGLVSKMDKIEWQQQQGVGGVGHSLVPARPDLPPGPPDPQALLAHITTIVTDNQDLRAKLDERSKKVAELSDSLTQLLQKNQKLLEEKTEMLVARQQEAGVGVTELLTLREEKLTLTTQLAAANHQLTTLNSEVTQHRMREEEQQKEIENLKIQINNDQMMIQQVSSAKEDLVSSSQQLEDQVQSLLQQNKLVKEELASVQQQQEDEQLHHQQLQDQLAEAQTQLKLLQHQLEQEKTKEDNAGTTAHSSQQAVEENKARISQLEEEVERLVCVNSQLQDDSAKAVTSYEETIQQLRAERDRLAGEQQDQATVTETTTTVKNAMNTVYRTLKSNISSEDTYPGADVLQMVLAVIRDTTLSLIENLEKKEKSVDGGRGRGAASTDPQGTPGETSTAGTTDREDSEASANLSR